MGCETHKYCIHTNERGIWNSWNCRNRAISQQMEKKILVFIRRSKIEFCSNIARLPTFPCASPHLSRYWRQEKVVQHATFMGKEESLSFEWHVKVGGKPFILVPTYTQAHSMEYAAVPYRSWLQAFPVCCCSSKTWQRVFPFIFVEGLQPCSQPITVSQNNS